VEWCGLAALMAGCCQHEATPVHLSDR